MTLAERVRDNLILDSGIAVFAGDPLSVRLTIRAQASHFPGRSADEVRLAALGLTEPFEADGFALEDERSSTLPHPSDPERSIDTTYEVVLRRNVLPDDVETVLRRAFSSRRASADE